MPTGLHMAPDYEREQQTQEHSIHQVAGIGSFPADVTGVTKTGFSSVY